MNNQEEKIKKNYRVPSGYFDEMEQTILSNTVNKKPERTPRVAFFRPWMSIAAGFVLLIGAGVVWKMYQTEGHVANVDQTEIGPLDELDDELFAALILDEEEDNALEELADFLIELED